MGGPAMIDGVEHDEVDNFLFCSFVVNGVSYPSAEHFFQCMKAINKSDHDLIRSSSSALTCWQFGNRIKLRPDWEAVKVEIMYVGNKAKFEQNSDLAEKLTDSEGEIIFFNSTQFWNKWNGIIMERIRAELRQTAEDTVIAEKIKKTMDEFQAEIRSKKENK